MVAGSSPSLPPAASQAAALPTILEVVCRTTGLGCAAVGQRVAERWVIVEARDEIGLGLQRGDELDLKLTLCKDLGADRRILILPDVEQDGAYRLHPTPPAIGLRSYVAAPIILPDGETFGTLCAADRVPRDLSSPMLPSLLKLLAELIAIQISAHLEEARHASALATSAADLASSRRDLAASASHLTASRADLAASRADLVSSRADLATSRADLATSRADLETSRQEAASNAASLAEERGTSELREQFIAVLGHDLRNPLASIDAGAKLLERETLSERGRWILSSMTKSVARMSGLINDVLDFARGRLGGGIPVEVAERVPLAPMLRQVVEELRSSHPDRIIDADLDGIDACRCDPGRVGQLLSNLVANALTHGSGRAPIRVSGTAHGDHIHLSVTNEGKPIPPAAMANLFQPFVRGSVRPSQKGLGLGLYIASEIARAHAGTLEATSSPQETTFTFRMPL